MLSRVDIDEQKRNYEVDVLLAQGKVFMDNKLYMNARDSFERALLIDFYNLAAIRNLEQINKRLEEAAVERRKIMTRERVAEITWRWVDPIPIMERGITAPGGTAARPKEPEKENIWWKLENIVIPRINFDEATITTVVKYLKKRSKRGGTGTTGRTFFVWSRPMALKSIRPRSRSTQPPSVFWVHLSSMIEVRRPPV